MDVDHSKLREKKSEFRNKMEGCVYLCLNFSEPVVYLDPNVGGSFFNLVTAEPLMLSPKVSLALVGLR